MVSRTALVLVLVVGCAEPQGSRIQNASFESAGDGFACGLALPPTVTAGGWEHFCVGHRFGLPYATRRDGTGFVPTNGTYFLSVQVESGGTEEPQSGVRQDNVVLSSSTKLVFDYEAVGTVPPTTAGDPAFAKIEMLFTANGTTTLWSKSYAVGTVSEQVRDETAMLDDLPTPGRLTILATARGVSGQMASLDFRIDNIRLQ